MPKSKSRRAPAVRTVVRKALKDMAEEKFIDITLATLSITDTAVITDLFPVTEGTGREQRIGDKCSLRKVMLTYSLQPRDATLAQMVRIMLVQWKADTAIDTLQLNKVISDTSVNRVLSQYSHAMRAKFNILYDVIHTVPRITAEGEARRIARRVVRIPPSKKVQFNRSATTGKNKIFLIIVADLDATTDVNIDVNARITFVDL